MPRSTLAVQMFNVVIVCNCSIFLIVDFGYICISFRWYIVTCLMECVTQLLSVSMIFCTVDEGPGTGCCHVEFQSLIVEIQHVKLIFFKICSLYNLLVRISIQGLRSLLICSRYKNLQ